VSPVSGTTAHTYDQHGELATTLDARGILTTRTVDAADRVTLVDYPGTALDTTYTYGTTPALFDVGRLTGITRDGQTVAYAYDRFGRLTTDGALTYAYDANANRTAIGYPGNVMGLPRFGGQFTVWVSMTGSDLHTGTITTVLRKRVARRRIGTIKPPRRSPRRRRG
jgi:hypothetical protein